MKTTPKTLEALFEEAILKDDDIENAIENDLEDELLNHLEENRKISIFDSEFVMEGEM